MANASKLDKEIVDEFKYDWFGLSNQAQQILAKYKNVDVIQLNPEFDPTLNLEQIPEGLDLKRETKIRVGQYFFRQSILNSYGNACCVTGISNKELLVASHIKPWKDSDEKTERTNPKNGLCLNALHDKAFDKGLITIDKNYCIILSTKLSQTNMDDNTKNWFYSYSKRQINLPDKFYPGKDFIEYHNDVIFQK